MQWPGAMGQLSMPEKNFPGFLLPFTFTTYYSRSQEPQGGRAWEALAEPQRPPPASSPSTSASSAEWGSKAAGLQGPSAIVAAAAAAAVSDGRGGDEESWRQPSSYFGSSRMDLSRVLGSHHLFDPGRRQRHAAAVTAPSSSSSPASAASAAAAAFNVFSAEAAPTGVIARKGRAWWRVSC